MKMKNINLEELSSNEIREINGGDPFMDHLGTSVGLIVGTIENVGRFLYYFSKSKPNVPSNWK